MPTKEIPLRSVENIKRLRLNDEFMSAASEVIRLCDEIRDDQERVDELKPKLIKPLETTLYEDESSVEMDGHRITLVVPKNGRRYLDEKKLLRYISAAKLEKCYSTAKVGQPFVQVQLVVPRGMKARATKKLRKGLE